ncbi:hypothetical protein ACGIJG_04175 [Lacticaseibacillus rhamnosus]|uniref:hypothetical protein n=1 Tax=Lacticaseibacillus rhamnosus TaxID=47715 RepID=UPI0022E878CE|nr:hypothetical protein [Lacticaseibacillus rhamnosus]
MSNETKRDVFNDLLEELADAYITLEGEGIGDELTNEDKQAYLKDYDNALPDNLPGIPKAVGDVIVKLKHKKFSLSGAMSYAAVVSLSPWMTFEHEDTFALAWVLGVWRVEETGEIVKLEAEK